MRSTYIGRLALAVWAVLSIASLGQFLRDSAGAEGLLLGEFEERFVYSMLILNAPLSLLVAFVVPIADTIAQWAFLTFLGFLQWAVLLPLATARTRRWLATRRAVR